MTLLSPPLLLLFCFTSFPLPIRPQGTYVSTPLKPLLRNLRLGRRNRLRGVGIHKAAALLAVLELGADARADAGALAVVGAAALLAVGVVDAPARGELAAVAVADIARARGVGDGLGRDGHGDWGLSVSMLTWGVLGG